MKRLTLALALALAAAVTLTASAASYSGVARLPAVTWISQPLPAPLAEGAIRQTAKAFVPAFLVVTVGSAVRFPNDDSYFHSVYSESEGNAFDLGLYDTGPGKSVTMAAPGIVEVRCHVHGTMRAVILVVDGPFVQTVQPNQQYRIDGITPGAKTLHVWTGGTEIKTLPIVVKK